MKRNENQKEKGLFSNSHTVYRWFVYKTSYMHFSKFYRRDKKLSYLFAFCYIRVRFRLKAYFKFIKRVQVIHWQSFMFLAYCDTFKKIYVIL